MSPEQAEGIGTDHRTDIWSFGVVLYEMVAGQRPFRGDFDQAIVYSIVNEAPEPLTALRTGVPKEFERIVDKCTAKKPEQRYQSVEELLVDLRAVQSRSGVLEPARRPIRISRRAVVGGVAAAVAALGAFGAYSLYGRRPIDSLAVLPFINEGGNPDTDYLSEGISESLITTLSRLPRLKVKPRDTVFRYQGQDKDAQQAGLDLGVRAVLKGRVVQRGENLSISAELVDASDGNLLWRDQYNRKAADLLAIEREISAEIAEQLRLRLSGDEKRRLSTEATRDPEAYRLYLQGRYWWNRRTEEALKKSAEYFEQAIGQDPNYAEAWTGLADSFLILGTQGALLPAEAFPRVRVAARRAIEIDPSLADPHTTLGHLKTAYEWDWLGAEREFRRAIELNPEFATAHHWYAFHLESVGRPAEALAAMRRARELEPMSQIFNVAVAHFEYSARRYAQAAEEARKAIEMDPDFFRPHLALAKSYALQDRPQEAKSEFEQALRLSKGGLVTLTLAGAGLGYLGEREAARKLLADVIGISRKRYVAPWMPGFIHAAMGEKEPAFEYFDKAVQARALPPWFLRDPMLDGIRSEPRFQDLLQRMGLSP
jgi:serine/threonine-protein kinase